MQLFQESKDLRRQTNDATSSKSAHNSSSPVDNPKRLVTHCYKRQNDSTTGLEIPEVSADTREIAAPHR